MFSYELALGPLLGGRDPARRLLPHPATSWPRRRAASGTGTSSSRSSGFAVYLVAATAEVNRTPFDLPEAETELVAGLPHRVLVDALRPPADGRVREHDHGGRGGGQPLLRRLALARPLPARLAAVVLRQDLRRPLLLHLAAGHAAPAAATTSSWHFGWKVLVPAGHPEHPGHRGRGGLRPRRVARSDDRHPLLRVRGPGRGLRAGGGGAAQPDLQRLRPHRDALLAVRDLRPAGLALHRRAAGGGLRGRHHGALPLRAHAAGREAGGPDRAGRALKAVALALAAGPGPRRWGRCSWAPPGPRPRPSTPPRAPWPSVLFSAPYLYVFEATSILILAALVGSIVLARRDA